MQKAAEIALNDFRAGAWGRITLETPEQYQQWCLEAQILEAERQAKKAAGKKKAKAPLASADETTNEAANDAD